MRFSNLAIVSLLTSMIVSVCPISGADKTSTPINRATPYRFPNFPDIQTLPTPERTLNFPKVAVGGIAVLKKAYFVVDEVAEDAADKTINQKAQGTIKIPANRFVIFFPNHNYFANPHLLDGLPANSFDHVVFRYMSMDNNDATLGKPALAYLARFTGMRCIDLERAEINDEPVKLFKSLVNLEFIDLFSTEINGSFLKSLVGLKKLHCVAVNNVGFKPSEIPYFSQLSGLTTLNLSHNRLKDKDIESLAGCKNLVTLGLSSNPEITDGALKTFAKMPKLRNIDLRDTQMSEKALISLEQRGVHLRGRAPSRAANAPRRNTDSGGIEKIFSPFSRGREL